MEKRRRRSRCNWTELAAEKQRQSVRSRQSQHRRIYIASVWAVDCIEDICGICGICSVPESRHYEMLHQLQIGRDDPCCVMFALFLFQPLNSPVRRALTRPLLLAVTLYGLGSNLNEHLYSILWCTVNYNLWFLLQALILLFFILGLAVSSLSFTSKFTGSWQNCGNLVRIFRLKSNSAGVFSVGEWGVAR